MLLSIKVKSSFAKEQELQSQADKMLQKMWFDEILFTWQWWLLVLLDVLIVFDISVVTVTYMLIYQHLQSWKWFIIAHIGIAGSFAFIAEPALVHLGYYQLLKWKFIYSFPIYFSMPMFLRWVNSLLKKLSSG